MSLNMIKNLKKIIETYYYISTETNDDVTLVIESKNNNGYEEYRNEYFIRTELFNELKNVDDFLKLERNNKYYVYSDEAISEIVKRQYEHSYDYDKYIKMKNLREWMSSKEYNPYYIMKENGFLYSITSEYPISYPIYMSYIGGICNDRFKLKKVENILINHPWVHDIKYVDIPYYNCDKDKTEALEFFVHIPQQEFDKIYVEYKNTDFFGLSKIRELLAGWYINSPEAQYPFNDMLGLKPALFKKKRRSD